MEDCDPPSSILDCYDWNRCAPGLASAYKNLCDNTGLPHCPLEATELGARRMKADPVGEYSFTINPEEPIFC